uniref:ATP synthase complex subunit 8 n=1 Tax=Melanargia asiatica TaxID=679090 RepID=A0A0U1T9Y9_9NEOP|nr:ATP synthase F0 subunit 8 [Melanargia asiatica]YP_010528780.1 ATP synthase F0 subunit 8 [Melanargia meridionalis]AHH92988.1 ATP synthase F0 subunit 8 [Melanargia asiatica]UXW65902.1 ATP synthase F0 subunit 8 [Melanargia meridionalis]
MPQMMPINWLFSFLFFICIFILFNIINYYIFNYNYKFKNLSKTFSLKKNMFWKW